VRFEDVGNVVREEFGNPSMVPTTAIVDMLVSQVLDVVEKKETMDAYDATVAMVTLAAWAALKAKSTKWARRLCHLWAIEYERRFSERGQ